MMQPLSLPNYFPWKILPWKSSPWKVCGPHFSPRVPLSHPEVTGGTLWVGRRRPGVTDADSLTQAGQPLRSPSFLSKYNGGKGGCTSTDLHDLSRVNLYYNE